MKKWIRGGQRMGRRECGQDLAFVLSLNTGLESEKARSLRELRVLLPNPMIQPSPPETPCFPALITRPACT